MDDQAIMNEIIEERSMRVLLPDEVKRGDGDVRVMDPLRVVIGST